MGWTRNDRWHDLWLPPAAKVDQQSVWIRQGRDSWDVENAHADMRASYFHCNLCECEYVFKTEELFLLSAPNINLSDQFSTVGRK